MRDNITIRRGITLSPPHPSSGEGERERAMSTSIWAVHEPPLLRLPLSNSLPEGREGNPPRQSICLSEPSPVLGREGEGLRDEGLDARGIKCVYFEGG